MSRRVGAWTVLVVLAGAAVASAQKPVLLRYKYSTKTPLIYRTTTTVAQTQTVMGKQQKNRISTTEWHQYRLIRVAQDKSFALERENKGQLVTMKIGELGDYKFDSKADSNEKGTTLGDALTPVYETMYGSIIQLNQTPRGEVQSVKGLDALLGQVLKGNKLARQFVGGATDQGAKAGLKLSTPIFGVKPVKPGDSWTQTLDMEIPRIGKASGKKTYKFAAVETVKGRKVAKITYDIAMTVKVDLNTAGAKVTGETKIEKGTGTLIFDFAQGQIVSRSEAWTVAGNLTIAANGKEIAVKTTQKQTTKQELLDKLP